VLAIALAPFYPWIVNIWCESRLERTRFCIGKAFDKFCQEKFSFPAFIFNIDRVSTKAIAR
jgi:hypothetical protein